MKKLLIATLLVSAFMGMGVVMPASAHVDVGPNVGPVDVATNVGVVTQLANVGDVAMAILGGVAVQDLDALQIANLEQNIAQIRI